MVNFLYNNNTTQYVLVVPSSKSIAAYAWLSKYRCDCDRIYTQEGYCRMLLINPSREVIDRIGKKYPCQQIAEAKSA